MFKKDNKKGFLVFLQNIKLEVINWRDARKMNVFKINKIMNFILILVIAYALLTFVNQQSKLNSYKKDISYYSTRKEELKEKKEELSATQENVNSKEYIEEVARKQLNMYLPNETVYIIDINK